MNRVTLKDILIVFKKLIFIHLFFLTIMTLFRVVFFTYYSPLTSIDGYYGDIAEAFVLGFRLDLTVIGYIQALLTIALIVLYYLRKAVFLQYFIKFIPYYLFITYAVVSFFLCADFGFYSYFKEHINIIFFGFFDDDTTALLVTFWQNYNVLLILSLFFLYLAGLFVVIKRIFAKQNINVSSFLSSKNSILLFVIIFVLNFLAVRGTLGMYPLGKMIPNVSTDEFINKVSHNGMRAFADAYDARKKYLKRKYDLIKVTGFKDNIEKAFEIYKGTKDIEKQELLKNITFRTKLQEDNDYNVVVIMVESFGMPILKYQSEEFNILGELDKHFKEDILFRNFISSGDGTISSLQALLLNIPHRPKSFAFSQSIYKQTEFKHTPAFLFNNNGYESTFVYGGDLSWRNLGGFVKYQGYQNLEGKIDIFSNIKKKNIPEDHYYHPWGIYDEYLYEHIFNKLEKADKKQFIVALSTNNHPPYNVPKEYKQKSLVYNDEIKSHITGNFDLAQQRFKSYAYAVDQVGVFLDKFKSSKHKDNTIVVVTADNNTIDGIMKYDNNQLLNSKNIPLYFYIPQKLKESLSIDTEVFGSHKDIFPTIYNLTLKDQEYISIGHDLFDSHKRHVGFNGSMVVSSKNNINRLNKLSQKTDDELLQFYKANLAVTQFLIDSYKEGKNND